MNTMREAEAIMDYITQSYLGYEAEPMSTSQETQMREQAPVKKKRGKRGKYRSKMKEIW